MAICPSSEGHATSFGTALARQLCCIVMDNSCAQLTDVVECSILSYWTRSLITVFHWSAIKPFCQPMQSQSPQWKPATGRPASWIPKESSSLLGYSGNACECELIYLFDGNDYNCNSKN
eukprot:3892455-Amphidinium_carterae.1